MKESTYHKVRTVGGPVTSISKICKNIMSGGPISDIKFAPKHPSKWDANKDRNWNHGGWNVDRKYVTERPQWYHDRKVVVSSLVDDCQTVHPRKQITLQAIPLKQRLLDGFLTLHGQTTSSRCAFGYGRPSAGLPPLPSPSFLSSACCHVPSAVGFLFQPCFCHYQSLLFLFSPRFFFFQEAQHWW